MPPPSADALLRWYDQHHRNLPWRAPIGQIADPYHVWLSEIMLQQTTVKTVVPYYYHFLERFPTLTTLAHAERDLVLATWAGLGYYSRARNLHACAQVIAQRGGFPHDIPSLKSLPGIGPYTAAAIAAIAFGVPVVPVDGNVERITARIFNVNTPLPSARPLLTKLATTLNSDHEAQTRPHDFAQALFDLGALICSPRTPTCGLCPWQQHCAAYAAGTAIVLPKKLPKIVRPQRYGVHFLVIDKAGSVLLRRRPENGLLASMIELPGTEWHSTPWSESEALKISPVQTKWQRAGIVHHVFTHFSLELVVYVGRVTHFSNQEVAKGFLLPFSQVSSQKRDVAIPSVMKKCLSLGLKVFT